MRDPRPEDILPRAPVLRGAWRRAAVRRVALAAALLASVAGPGTASAHRLHAQGATGVRPSTAQRLAPLDGAAFARTIAELSEPGGFFDTDNLISNERSYLHVMGALDRRGVRGGAYVGVGPDQSFSYIARTRADLAFLLDVRRDNLLQHLLFKALFARARHRADYLALWLGRPVPQDAVRWLDQPIDAVVAHIDSSVATEESRSAARTAVREELAQLQMPLSEGDLATIERFHDAFIGGGLALRFTTLGRAPRPYYPTLRDLLLETDRQGRRASYLAAEADFQYVKELERRNLVIPVVGDLGGPHAMRAIGQFLAARNLAVSTLYVSNAEDYVLRDGKFGQYRASVAALPRSDRSVIIRSWFGGAGMHPQGVPGYFSVQLAQTFDDFLRVTGDGGLRWYGDLAFSPHLAP